MDQLYQVYAWFDSNWLLYYEVDSASLGKCEQDLEIYVVIIFGIFINLAYPEKWLSILLKNQSLEELYTDQSGF